MEKMVVNVRRYLIISSILALAASAAGCGSGGDRPGATGGTTGTPETTGGAVGSGGAVGNGGITGTPSTGGATATGGTTGPSVLSCTPAYSPALPLLTDFSTGDSGWHAAAGKWGKIGNLTGSIFNYGAKMAKASVDTTNQQLVLSGDVAAGDFGGGGMSFDSCVNTSTYTGVQFTLGGTAAGCNLKFQLQTFSQQADTNGGGCPAAGSCYGFPNEVLQSTTGPVVVKFADLALTGKPVAAADMAKEIVGLQWQFESPGPVGDAIQLGCTGIALTITNVLFVSN